MSRTALLIVDMQEAMITGAMHHQAAVLANLARLLHCARASDTAVIHVRHDFGEGHKWGYGTPGWQIHAPLAPMAGEAIIDKRRNSAFFGTNLGALLREKGIDTLVICGVHTEFCIDATIRTAFDLGYQVHVPADANSTEGNEYLSRDRLHAYYNRFLWPGRFAQVITMQAAEHLLGCAA